MQRRDFLGLSALAGLGTFWGNAILRAWDWLTYRPWTDEEIADRVAWMMAHAAYRPWHSYNVYARIPIYIARPGGLPKGNTDVRR